MAIAVMSIVILGGCALILVWAFRSSRGSEAEEQETLAALAAEHGMHHEFDSVKLKGHELDLGFESFEIRSGRRRIRRRMWSPGGDDGAFEFVGVSGDYRIPSTYFSCGLVALPTSRPGVVIETRGAVKSSRGRDRRGAEGIAVPGLDERFRVTADDERAARELLDATVLRWLDANAERLLSADAGIEFHDRWLLVRFDGDGRSLLALEYARSLAATVSDERSDHGRLG